MARSHFPELCGLWADESGNLYPVSRYQLCFKYRSHAAARAFVYRRDNFTCQRCGWRPQTIPEAYDGRYAISGEQENRSRKSRERRNNPIRIVSLDIDHVWPRARGGHNHPANLQTLCFPCNAGKCDRVMA